MPGAIAEDGSGDEVPMGIRTHCSPEYLRVARFTPRRDRFNKCDAMTLRRYAALRLSAVVLSVCARQATFQLFQGDNSCTSSDSRPAYWRSPSYC